VHISQVVWDGVGLRQAGDVALGLTR